MNILYLVLNDFTGDSRVLRAAQTCLELGGTPTVFALHRFGLLEEEITQGVQVKRFRLLIRSWSKRKLVRLLRYGEAMIQMVRAGRYFRPDLIHANDLPTLPIGYIIGRAVGARLLYDSHELWADSSHRALVPAWMFNMGLAVERAISRKADAIITVSESIADEMARNMGIDQPTVIRNVAIRGKVKIKKGHNTNPLRESLDIPRNVPVLLYQGGIMPGRGLMTLVKAMGRILHPTAVLVFLGNGPMVSDLKSAASSCGLQRRVYFHPAVPVDELHEWTRDATLGISSIEPVCLSHKLCLPNKLFEYIQAGLPVLATDVFEMQRIVQQYGVGEVFPEGDPSSLADKIDTLLYDEKLLRRYHDAAIAAAQELNWETEKGRLIAVYQQVLDP